MNNDSQRWLTLVACMLASLVAGFGYAWSVFMKPLVSTYNWSAAGIALSFTLLMSTAATTAIFAGIAQIYMKPRTIVLLGGALFGAGIACIGFIQSLSQLYICVIVGGIGLGCVYPGGTMTNTVRFFPDKSGFASGLLTAGYGAGAIIWAPFSAVLIAQFGLSNALKILGILFFVVIAFFSRLVTTAPEGYRPKGWVPTEKSAKTSGGVEKDWRGMLKDPMFYLLAVTFTLGEITGMMIIGNASPIAQDMLKMTPQAAAGIVGLLAFFTTGGKFAWGWISDRIGRYTVVALLFIIGGAAMIGLTMVSGYTSFVIVIAMVGICYGGYLSIMAPLTADLFGTKNLGINFGIMFLTIAIAAYVGPALAVAVKQANNGDYTQAFIIAVVLNLIGLLLFGIFMFLKNKKKVITLQNSQLSSK